AALASGRSVSLALCTVLSACFYPIVTPVAGMTLAIWLLFPHLAPIIPRQAAVLRGSLQGKFLFLGATACLALLAMAPMVQGHFSTEYGRILDPASDREAFPEINHYPSPPALALLLLIYHLGHSTRLGGTGGFILMV